MALSFIQLPVANLKKSLHGETDLSSADRSSWPFAGADVAAWSPRATSPPGQPGLAGERISTKFAAAGFGATDCADNEAEKRLETAKNTESFRPCVIRTIP